MQERWRDERARTATGRRWRAGRIATAAIAARDRLDQLVKPSGSLGALEALIERWAAITGAPPPSSAARRGADLRRRPRPHHPRHEPVRPRGLRPGRPPPRRAATAPSGCWRGRAGHDVLVADVGLAGPTPTGVRDAKVAPGPPTCSRDRR